MNTQGFIDSAINLVSIFMSLAVIGIGFYLIVQAGMSSLRKERVDFQGLIFKILVLILVLIGVQIFPALLTDSVVKGMNNAAAQKESFQSAFNGLMGDLQTGLGGNANTGTNITDYPPTIVPGGTGGGALPTAAPLPTAVPPLLPTPTRVPMIQPTRTPAPPTVVPTATSAPMRLGDYSYLTPPPTPLPGQ